MRSTWLAVRGSPLCATPSSYPADISTTITNARVTLCQRAWRSGSTGRGRGSGSGDRGRGRGRSEQGTSIGNLRLFRPPDGGNKGGSEMATRLADRRDAVAKDTNALQLVVEDCLRPARAQLLNSDILTSLGVSELHFMALWRKFCIDIVPSIFGAKKSRLKPWVAKFRIILRDTFLSQGQVGIVSRLRHIFLDWILSQRFTVKELEKQKEVLDLRYPHTWNIAAREQVRTIHLHVGPTNSGKTYNALKRLEEAGSGIYAGPLRLLAHEVFTRLQAKNLPCILLTGEEQRFPDAESSSTDGNSMQDPEFKSIKNPLISCTVEMVPKSLRVPVAILDEIQMLNHPQRGWAWTDAFLALNADEVHVCGEDRAVPIIQKLAALCGDELKIHRYERLSPLQLEPKSMFGQLKNLRKGDCVISFSVRGCHALQHTIEKNTGKKVAIIYGSLPPETRAHQAQLFNDPTNDYDFLVATDAIGMGLNLAIGRVIFEATAKHNGFMFMNLSQSELKQIGGRAGRFRTSHDATHSASATASDAMSTPPPTNSLDGQAPTQVQAVDTAHVSGIDSKTTEASPAKVEPPLGSVRTSSVGLVTTLDQYDYPYLVQAFEAEAEQITTAGLKAPDLLIQRFADYFPKGTPLSYIMTRLQDTALLGESFMFCDMKDQLLMADAIEAVENLTLKDRITFTACPNPPKEAADQERLTAFARCIADGNSGNILDIRQIDLGILEKINADARARLHELVNLHKGIVQYCWLSYRFTGVFNTRDLALHIKTLVETQIAEVMPLLSWDERRRHRIRAIRTQQERTANQMQIELESNDLKEELPSTADALMPQGEPWWEPGEQGEEARAEKEV